MGSRIYLSCCFLWWWFETYCIYGGWKLGRRRSICLGWASLFDSGCKFQFVSADANFNPPDFGLWFLLHVFLVWIRFVLSNFRVTAISILMVACCSLLSWCISCLELVYVSRRATCGWSDFELVQIILRWFECTFTFKVWLRWGVRELGTLHTGYPANWSIVISTSIDVPVIMVYNYGLCGQIVIVHCYSWYSYYLAW